MIVTKGMQKQGVNGFEKLIELYLKNRQKTSQAADLNELHLDEDALSTFVEGNLNQKESISIVKHLIDCASCRRATAEIVRLAESVERISTKDNVLTPSNSNSFLQFWKILNEKLISPIDQAAVAYEDPEVEQTEDKLTQSSNSPKI